MTDNAPLPRLELRWRKPTEDEKGYDAICEYGLVLPVDRADIRSNEVDADGYEVVGVKSEVFYVFGTTSCGGDRCGHEPGRGPFRDSVHAQWDSEKLGGLPIYVRTLDGDLAPLNLERR